MFNFSKISVCFPCDKLSEFTMDAYVCIEHVEDEIKPSNAILVRSGSKMKVLIDKSEQYLLKHTLVTLSATGKAINKAVSVVEILKRNNKLYQYNHLSSFIQTDLWVAQEPLDTIKVEKHEPILTITVSFNKLNNLTDCTEQSPA